MFSDDEASVSESSTKLCFVEFARWRHQSDVRQRYVSSSLPDGGIGGDVAVYDCRLVDRSISESRRRLGCSKTTETLNTTLNVTLMLCSRFIITFGLKSGSQ